MKDKIQWINCSKFVAILAVIVDHSYGILYSNQDIAYASYFSVSLFIIISGMTSYLSNQAKGNEKWHQTYWRTSRKLVIAYLIAAFVCLIIKTHQFDLMDYCIGILKFNIQGPFYFVALYLQLMLVNRLFYNLLAKTNLKKDIFFGSIILLFTAITTRYTNVFDIYGGGGKLLGGTYLFCYYLGMIFIKYDIFRNKLKRGIVFTLVGIIGYLSWWKFVCIDELNIDSKLPFGRGFNPPSISFIVMAIMVLCAVYGVCTILQNCKFGKVVDSISCIGTHTLYIFLYHRIILDSLSTNLKIRNRIVECFIYVVIMIGGSIFIERAIYGIKILGRILIKNEAG